MSLYEQIRINNEMKAVTVVKTRKELLERSSVYELEQTIVTVKCENDNQVDMPLFQLLKHNVYITNLSKLETAIDELEVYNWLTAGIYLSSLANVIDTLNKPMNIKSLDSQTLEVEYSGKSYFKLKIYDCSNEFKMVGYYMEDCNSTSKHNISYTYKKTMKDVISLKNKIKSMIR